ncbi:PTS glucitol/sorbitol transporter subunit IIA, partial [Bacillus pumilus]|uniref:PTS glucitol/sorbitol transporter subunit IIA n=1 Tax=Bacillus pumilus TaxID=1408 RepID=UPI00119FA447
MVTQSILKQIPILLPQFKQHNLILLFPPPPPHQLTHISLIHHFQHLQQHPFKLPATIQVPHQTYTITPLPNKPNRNFKELGDISIY